jgi:hypothetical protein
MPSDLEAIPSSRVRFVDFRGSAAVLGGCRAGVSPAHPNPLPISELSLSWVVRNIAERPFKLRLVSKQSVIAISLPGANDRRKVLPGLPVWEPAAIADIDFAEAWARRPRDSRRDAGATVGVLCLRHGREGLRRHHSLATKSRIRRWPTCPDQSGDSGRCKKGSPRP